MEIDPVVVTLQVEPIGAGDGCLGNTGAPVSCQHRRTIHRYPISPPAPSMCSGHLRRPALLTDHVVGPTLAAAGEHRDAVHPGVVPKPVAGHADLAAPGLEQHRLIEVGPLLNRGFEPGIQCCGSGERGTHESWSMRTPVLAQLKGLG
jgi:hypothetical protein